MKNRFLKLFVLSSLIFAACNSDYKGLGDGIYADMETDRGTIILELYPKEAPLTVANFITLAEGTNPMVPDSIKGKKYYDGLGFHRVVPDFIIQSGDPTGSGRGPLPGYRFYNELTPKLRHDSAGILSMANGGFNTNGSQFFITHKPTPWLDGYNNSDKLKDCTQRGVYCHTIFGKVVTGQDVVDSIAQYDMIKSVKIIRIGDEAKSFDAVKEFEAGMARAPEKEKERLAELEKSDKERYEKFLEDKKVFEAKMDVDKAKKMESGLKVITYKKGKGKKFNRSVPVSINYTIYLASGKLIQSSEGKKPLTFTLDQTPLIPGVTEAITTMREGGKKRLFIPYYIGYGEKGGGPFPPKADLIFDLELLKVGK
ncbi:peptidylprolyl isomerase [Pseudotenacibaculum sp. MALMAid0570]|uniref:peptidylprolyl isomerase n=1 Tax=Pseudotenacibaculum sp. MALMAid0570 TaxID=3143938 RepID=UPI0032DEE82E